MSRKHFERIAAIIAKIPNESIRAMVAADLATYFAEINEKFDTVRFLNAVNSGN